MTAAALEELVGVLPTGTVGTDPDTVAAHRCDRARFCPTGTAAALVRATSTADVAAVMRVASRHRVPVVPQGARSGISGGANAVDGAILLSLERMDSILVIDDGEMIARVQPGVLNATLSGAVADRGLHYPPDPSSWEYSTLGGNIATNAGGLCCVKYGVTADFVRGLEVVLADGRVLRTGRQTVKGVAGYDLTRLFVGSEGTLGVVTEAVLALRPAAEPALTAVMFFDTLADACATVADVMAAGLRPSMLEFMDEASVDIVRSHRDLGFPDGAAAMLLIAADTGANAGADLARAAALAENHGGAAVVASDQVEAGMLLEARRSLGPATERLGASFVEDVCVPRKHLGDLVAGVHRIGHERRVRTACAGHAGDGNLHPKVIFDAGDPDEVTLAQAAFDDIMALGLRLGGTITGEHGVGLLKRDWLETELGEVSLDVHHGLKDLLDPLGILNPGKVLGPVRAGTSGAGQ